MSDEDGTTLLELLARLLFISQIAPNEKMDTESIQMMEDNYYTSAYRTFKYYFMMTQSRKTTLKFIEDTFKQAFWEIKKYADKAIQEPHMKNTNDDIIAKLGAGLKHSRMGINNIKRTYIAEIGRASCRER